MNQKSILAILGVVVVILIGTAVYFATINKANQSFVPAPITQQPTLVPVAQQPENNQPVVNQPTPTQTDSTVTVPASWKTYVNDGFAIKFQYPAKIKTVETRQKSQVLKGVTLFSISLLPVDEKKYFSADGNQGGFMKDNVRKGDNNSAISNYRQAVKSGENILVGNTGLKWYCENSVTPNGFKTKSCLTLNKAGNLDSLDFGFKDMTFFSESEFDTIVKSFEYTN